MDGLMRLLLQLLLVCTLKFTLPQHSHSHYSLLFFLLSLSLSLSLSFAVSAMDELYGLHSTATDYSVDNYLVNNYAHSFPPPVAGFGDRIPLFRPDRLLSGSVSSVVSDAASMVAEIQRGGAEEEVSGATRAKIASHPLYPKLLQAYIDCQKVWNPAFLLFTRVGLPVWLMGKRTNSFKEKREREREKKLMIKKRE
jgi:hypothetical protein